MSAFACRLYLITPPAIPDPAAFVQNAFIPALDAGDVACVQLRLKDVDDDVLRRAADMLRPIAQERGVAFVINDRPDLAAEAGADGVHIGQDDATYEQARVALGPEAIVGVTCHASRDLAFKAAGDGADYVAFGAFFPTMTKEPRARADVDLIEGWSLLATTPCVAIGGIGAENCAPLVRAGADFLAVSSYVWSHAEGADAGVAAMNRAIAEASS